MSLVKLDKVTLAYGEHIMLRDVDFEMGPSEIVTIVGPNGSGKTSLVKTIIGALTPKSGRVTLRPQLNIGYVPQRLNIDATFPMTVGRFLRLHDQDVSGCHRPRAPGCCPVRFPGPCVLPA